MTDHAQFPPSRRTARPSPLSGMGGIFLLAFALLWTSLSPLQAAEREKVLLDTDMVECFDDGIAMTLLANAPNVELVGVTTLSGNSWVEQGTAYAIRQLEIEKATHVPVAQGLQLPLRPQRHDLFGTERRLVGRGHDLWIGSFGFPRPTSWQTFYEQRYDRNPSFAPVDKHAVNFIIDTVRANPGQITIANIGPCGNLALAVRMAPDIVPLIKRVIYMGGAFFQQGNITPAAEFNWYFDPEAARIALRSPFREQIILGLDVCEKVVFRKEHYDRLIKTLGASPMAELLNGTFVGQSFGKNPDFTHYVWDVLVSAVIIDPTLITKEVTRFVDINDQWGLSYGQSLAYAEDAPAGAQKARIVLEVDEDRFWDMLNDPQYWRSIKK